MTTTSPLQPPAVVPEFDLADRCIKARKVGRYERQEDLSAASGISVRTISRYESGKTTRPSVLVLRTWAFACGVRYEWLKDGEGWESSTRATSKRHTGPGAKSGNVRPGRAVVQRAA